MKSRNVADEFLGSSELESTIFFVLDVFSWFCYHYTLKPILHHIFGINQSNNVITFMHHSTAVIYKEFVINIPWKHLFVKSICPSPPPKEIPKNILKLMRSWEKNSSLWSFSTTTPSKKYNFFHVGISGSQHQL